MIANGWRPLTNSYEETIGMNVSPSSQLEKNVQVHPVLSKVQEHMATSEKLKPPRKGKPPMHEYNPPSILGSFSVFGHAATKARGETKAPSKYVASATQEYTFLIPPPKDAYRFEGYTTNRPYVPPFAMPQALQPPRHHQAKPFESLKVGGNAKPYFQPPLADVSGDFGNKQKTGNDRDAYNDHRYQVVAQSHNAQVLSSASSGNFYSQINHHSPSHFKSTYERDPAFLVHESHEVSYVTPSGTYNAYNFRPSLPYETLLPPAVYSSSSTLPPTTTAVTPRAPAREHDYKRTDQATRNKQDKGGHTELPSSRTTGTYYVSEHRELTPSSTWPKNKYTSDINEVLPRENPPGKFSQEIDTQNQVAYRRPHNPYEPVEVYPPTTVEYETPESISLKHFNEQQYLLQQQLLQRDREQLAEQERQQKLEIERQQQEELKKRQQELNQLLQQEKEEQEEEEAARLAAESAKNQSQELIKISDMPYTIQLAQFEPQITTADPSILLSQPGIYNVEQLRVQPQIPENQVNYPYQQHFQNEYQEQQVDYRDPQAESRPYRPQKPSRDQHRRKKPTTASTYELAPTEPPSQQSDTSVPLTLHVEEVPVQTTVAPESQTLPTVTTQKSSRTRRPGSSHRRRKPSTTTQEPVTESQHEEDFLKYNRGGEDTQANHHESSRRRRIKPTQATYTGDDTGTEKRTNSRKRPSHRTRVNQLSESYDAQVVTDNSQPLTSYGHEIVEEYNNENKQFATSQPSVPYGTAQQDEQYITNQPINQYYDYTSQLSEGYREEHREDTTAPPVQVEYYGTERSRDKVVESYNAGSRQQNGNIVTSIPLEELYVRTDDGNYYDRATTAAPTSTTTTTATTTTTTTSTTTTTTTTPRPTTQSAQVISSTLRSHKIRPLRYGNATRPRFSIKDYKSRLDYKSRVQQQTSTTESPSSSTTETSIRSPYKQRTSSARTQQQQQVQQPTAAAAAAEPVRETTGRYKYVSRMNYRSTTPASGATKEHERLLEESASSTTEKSNRFVPKRRPISGNVYRSRIASTTSSPTRSQVNGETNARQSSVRPENVYSSSIRRRPAAKSRPQHPHKEAVAAAVANAHPERRRQQESTEMAAEETNFYSAMSTTAASTTRLVANEIVSEKGEAVTLDTHPVKLGVQENKNEGQNRLQPNGSSILMDEEKEDEKQDKKKEEMVVVVRAQSPVEPSGDRHGDSKVQPTEPTASENDRGEKAEGSRKEAEAKAEAKAEAETETEITTKFDVRSSDEEELFAKASQSVADLTSSASALYDKPGMFKAVSPESRLVSPAHFKITTDEPTLPIEAFFQELTKKN
ncbi:hypothetical protein EAI_01149 [Harpegnathos saltator]|uniref:Uncharacterized protein n=1 Tax=Harpegnathos saltator TaxID=610380 RepID=E2BBW3_HARSA|nr:hypothetical protein EAI_01149 [Harpegnathos saltator]